MGRGKEGLGAHNIISFFFSVVRFWLEIKCMSVIPLHHSNISYRHIFPFLSYTRYDCAFFVLTISQLISSSDKISAIQEPVLLLNLTVGEGVNKKEDVLVELSKEDLDSLLETLSGVNEVFCDTFIHFISLSFQFPSFIFFLFPLCSHSIFRRQSNNWECKLCTKLNERISLFCYSHTAWMQHKVFPFEKMGMNKKVNCGYYENCSSR